MFSGIRPAGRGSNASGSDGSITSILPTPALRVELAMLLLLCTDAMRKEILALFEPPVSTPRPFEDLISLDISTESIKDRSQENARDQEMERRKMELSSTEMLHLRHEAFKYFDRWRVKVLRRICDVLGVQSEVVKNARRQYVTRAAAEEKRRRDEEYYEWAKGNDPRKEPSTTSQPRYLPIPTRLDKLDEEKRILVLNCVLLLLLSLESYSSHSRILLLHLTSSLQLETGSLVEHENQVARGLLKVAHQADVDEVTRKQAADNATARKWKVGLATVAGAALIGVTGGLAAPLLAAGVGTVLGGLGLGATAVSGLLGALAANGVLIGALFGAYGGKMTGQIVDELAKDVEDFRFVPLQGTPTDPRDPRFDLPLDRNSAQSQTAEDHKLRVAIGITGWLTTESDIYNPGSFLISPGVEAFALRWEVTALLRLGVSFTSVLKTYVWKIARFELVRRTLFGTLAMGLWPLGLLKIGRVLDNPFNVGRARADKAGKVLAGTLIAKCQGERPVTLIGYSLGARVIYSCLLELAAQKAFGLVENAVLLGAPAPSDSEPWTIIRSVVMGRVVNVYCKEDYILGFLYRTGSAQIHVAGLQPIESVQGVESIDVTGMVDGHTKYRYLTGKILQNAGFDDINVEEVERQMQALKALESKEAQSNKKETDAEMEVVELERKMNDVVGGKVDSGITMVDFEDDDVRKKAELLETAEKEDERKKREALRALEEDISARIASHSPGLDSESKANSSVRDINSGPQPGNSITKAEVLTDHKAFVEEVKVIERPPTHIRAGKCNDEPTKIIPIIQIQDLDSEAESENLEPMNEIAYLDPEPEPDSEPETEQVSFGTAGRS